jgi:hypothetical protein
MSGKGTPTVAQTFQVLFYPTTSFLTTASLTYAIGAGITAGAGTRRVLQLVLVGIFDPYSFRMWTPNRGPKRYFLSLPL